jgi:hypothetical protein
MKAIAMLPSRRAIRATHSPLLTQVYLASHTLQEAAARGIDVPIQVAVK